MFIRKHVASSRPLDIHNHLMATLNVNISVPVMFVIGNQFCQCFKVSLHTSFIFNLQEGEHLFLRFCDFTKLSLDRV